MAFNDAPPTAEELQRARKKLQSQGVPSMGPTAPKPQSYLDAPPTQEELNFARSEGRTRLSPEQAAELARQQGFDESSRGLPASFARGTARTLLSVPSLPAETIGLAGAAVNWTGGQIANWIDPRNPVIAWKDAGKTEDIPLLKHFGAKSIYENITGPDALNIFPHRRPDETDLDSAGGTLGELAPLAVGARNLAIRSVNRSAGPVLPTPTITGRPRPYMTQAEAARARTLTNRAAVIETGLGVAGSEVGKQIDQASGGDGSKGQAIGSIVAPLAPLASTAAATTTKFVLRGGERGRQEMVQAINASDALDDAAGRTYRPTGTQRVLDAVGGGTGRPVNLTAGQAAPRAGLVRTIERLAAYFPGGYPVLAKRIASQLENARDTVTRLADRAVERFNRQAGAENASRRSRQSYQMQTQGRYATNALDETIPSVGGLNDEAAGQAIDRGLRERVAMNENLRRIAEADFEALMPRDTQTGMNSTINTLEALEARLPNAPSVSTGTLRSPVIGNLRDELINDAVNAPNGGVTIPFEVLRRVRTRVGEFLNGDTRALGPAGMGEADARRLYAALTEDMATAARNAGPDAWLSWQTAQAVTRSGAEVAGDVRQVLNRQTMEGVEAALASGEGSRVRDAMTAMPQRDRDLVVANIFRKWGEAKPGQQDADGTAWSFNRWLTNVNEARQRGSFEALTGTSAREMTGAIDALNTVAGRVKARADFMPNNSGSGRIITSTNTLLGAAATAPIDMGLSAAITATGIVAPNLMARLTTNPRFIRWLARTAETPPQAMAGHLLRLGTFANNPETAAGVREFTNAFMEEFEKGDALDRAAMIDPTPVSETARQVRSYMVEGPQGQAPKQLNAGNVLASAGAIGLAALGLGGGKAAQLRGAFNLSARNLSKFEAKFAADMEAAVAKGNLPEVTERYAKFIAEAKQYASQENNQEALARLTALEQRAAAAGRPAASIEGSFDATSNTRFRFAGKDPKDMTPQDFAELGRQSGVENLGPLTAPVAYKYMDGGAFSIPGGTEGKFTYYDMLKIKADGIDASKIPEDLHAKIQAKLSRSMTAPELSDEQVWSGLIFGLTSPNNPLQPNQMAMSRLRMNSTEDLKRLASMITWEPGDDAARNAIVRREAISVKNEKGKTVTQEVERTAAELADKRIAQSYGLNAGSEGGLGVRGTQDYTRAAELAKLFLKNPRWFRRREGEEWAGFAERVFTQVAGLKAKTGSFGVVFQDPVHAAISAIDRHMATIFADKVFKDDATRLAWSDRALSLYNARNNLKGKNKVTRMDQLPNGFIGEMLLAEVGKNSSPKYRLAGGAKNTKGVPRALVDENFIVEPKSYELMGETYKRVLAENARRAEESGLGLFSSQWMLWDRQRRRLEPHENMFPGLERIPRMSVEQLREVNAAHSATGHRNYSKVVDADGNMRLQPTKKTDNPSGLAYFGIGGLGLGLAVNNEVERERRGERPR